MKKPSQHEHKTDERRTTSDELKNQMARIATSGKFSIDERPNVFRKKKKKGHLGSFFMSF